MELPDFSHLMSNQIRDPFNLFDVDCDGVINHSDLKTALNSLGFEFNESEIERLIAEVDPKKTGVIDFEIINAKMGECEQIDDFRSAFDMIDDECPECGYL
jgi:calcium-binding protein CML